VTTYLAFRTTSSRHRAERRRHSKRVDEPLNLALDEQRLVAISTLY
jgi:hypothetical protein